MFKIGEFSRLSKVTIDTLRHYDAIGLLKPVHIDPFTGYRYYSARQLAPLNHILMLKELGFPLKEITHMMKANLTTEELMGLLKVQLTQAERELELTSSRVEKLRDRLNHLMMEDQLMTYEVTIKSFEACTVAEVREIVPTVEQMPERCGTLFNQIAGWLVSESLPIGVPMTTYFNEGHSKKQIDMACAFTIPTNKNSNLPQPQAPIQLRECDPIPHMAVTVVTDDFYKKVEGLTPAYQAMGQWIENNGYEICGPQRELFYSSVEQGDLTAEIQIPVQKSNNN